MASSFSSFSADKRGYNAYLKSLGIDPKAQVFNPMVLTMSQFVQAVNAVPENRLDALHEELERVNELWYAALMRGEDDRDDIYCDAYHLRRNASRLVREIEGCEESIFHNA